VFASGFLAKKLPSGKVEFTSVHQYRINKSIPEENALEFQSTLHSWVKLALRSAQLLEKQQQQGNNAPFNFPNQGSMDFQHSFVQSVDFSSGGSLPKLPSFSGLSLPYVQSRHSIPKAPKTIDVQLPSGKTMQDYWMLTLQHASSPFIVLSSSLNKIAFANLSFQVLMGSQTDFSEMKVEELLGEGDMGFLKAQADAIVSQQISFFVHLATFQNNAGESPALLVGETNVSGCFTQEGWFLVVEIWPLFSKKLGIVTSKNTFPEAVRFDSFFANAPTPAAVVAPSGIILAANLAFARQFANWDATKTPIIGEYFKVLLSTSSEQFASQVAEAISSLTSNWFVSDARSIVLEGKNAASVVGLSFMRGTNLNHDDIKCFLLTCAAADDNKRRRLSLSNP